MKFWQKIFLWTLVIFIIVFDAGVYFLVSYSNRFNYQREADGAVREQSVILSSVAGRIDSAEKFYPGASQNKERLTAVIKPLAEYYAPQGVLLALYENETAVFSNMAEIDAALLTFDGTEAKNTMDMLSDGKRYMYAASKIPDYPHLTFIYARDISGLDVFKEEIRQAFLTINITVVIALGLSIFLLLKFMTRPITRLNKTAFEIAGGAYDKRAEINRSDELGVLAQSFNRMAASVEENIIRLTKAAAEKQQFIDDLSHEMKTPLTSILGYAEYLQNAKNTEEDRVVAAGHLKEAAARLENLSDKLLRLTALRSGEFQFQDVPVAPLFETLTEIMRLPLLPRGIKLITQSDIEYIRGDETLLLSMLSNLVENAARAYRQPPKTNKFLDEKFAHHRFSEVASKENGTVTLKAYSEDCPVIEVADNGRGMEKQELEKITAPFYRTDKSRSRQFGGVGLGLSIVSQIALLHGAKLEINSEPGKGTIVKIRFTR